jgi:peroxiredoxin
MQINGEIKIKAGYFLLLLIAGILVWVTFSGCGNTGEPDNSIEQKSTSDSELEQYNQNVIQQYREVKDIAVGDVAPDFTLTDVSGKTVSLSVLRGKKVLINMWWLRCKGCADEMEYFQSIHEKWYQQELVVMAISTYDTASIVRAYAQAKKLTYTMIVDEAKQIHRSYIICGVPTTFLVDEEGVVRAKKDGAFNGVEEIEAMLREHDFIK